jgi:NADH-quinone oxidoreductase subunit M
VIQKVLYGEKKLAEFEDLRSYEILSLIPLALLILAMGIFPSYFIEKIKPTASEHLKKELYAKF